MEGRQPRHSKTRNLRALGKACHTTLGDGRVIQSSFRKVYQCPPSKDNFVGTTQKVMQIATAGFKNEGLHWSELDECDILASEDSDSEGEVDVERQDNAWMRDSDDCSADGRE